MERVDLAGIDLDLIVYAQGIERRAEAATVVELRVFGPTDGHERWQRARRALGRLQDEERVGEIEGTRCVLEEWFRLLEVGVLAFDDAVEDEARDLFASGDALASSASTSP